MTYTCGLHILADFKSDETHLLSNHYGFKSLINKLIEEQELHNVGEVYHDFDNAGYTAVICLTESHISIHTWPEFGTVTFDIFLSNFSKNNNETGRYILKEVLAFFKSVEPVTKEIRR